MKKSSKRPGILAAVALGMVAIGAVAALAEGEVPGLPPALKKLLDCRGIAADPQRLACYDAAAAELSGLLTRRDIVAVDQQQVQKVRRQAFGLKLPTLSLFDRGGGGDGAAKPEELSEIAATVADARQRADGTWVLELDDGATWAQVDQEHLPRSPHKGSTVKIRKAAMATYFLNVDGQRAIRAKRVE